MKDHTPSPGQMHSRSLTIVSALTVGLVQGAAAQTLTSPTSPSSKTPSTAQSGPLSPSAKIAPNPPKSCSLYGEGFVAVPGTDTCVKASGYVRTDTVIRR